MSGEFSVTRLFHRPFSEQLRREVTDDLSNLEISLVSEWVNEGFQSLLSIWRRC
jgi:hypothetical protein